VKHIVVTGPESSGKTTLAQYLAAAFQTLWVPEYARTYLEQKQGPYLLPDLINISIGQVALMESTAAEAAGKACIILDTWMLELAIWAEYRFGSVPEVITDMLSSHQPDLYVLCTPDLPWKPDPLRENPDDRDQLYLKYHRAVLKSGIPYVTVSGTGPVRERAAYDNIRSFITKKS